ncbi:unnamed protein product [Rangifer tarandus platyrhynchus]|uniref:Uncharacterized protein n=2 Tax=Rangifer tarandus platyrhynchus TaxID=3082113 RepID=A0AC59ZML8_RANTA|nr:unnamed protein product [Rangifer tarandus platyrhynchus]
MRMKEVSSVSRMRLLTSRGVDSTEEPKAERDPGVWPGGLVTPSAGHKLSNPQGALSLEADRHPAVRREENGGRDFWCPEIDILPDNSRTSQVVLVIKNPPANAGDMRGVSLIPESGRSSGGGHGNPHQYSCLENPMDRGAWRFQSMGLQRVGHD